MTHWESYSTEAEWLAARFKRPDGGPRIPASCVAACVGVDPWLSRYSLTARMHGIEAWPDLSGELRIVMGHIMQPHVRDLWIEETGTPRERVADRGAWVIAWNDEWPWLCASLDYVVLSEDKQTAIATLDCKAVSQYSLPDWTNGMPEHYQPQAATQAQIVGAEYGMLAAVIGNTDFRWGKVERREIDRRWPWILECTQAVIDDVVNERMPDPDGHKSTTTTVVHQSGKPTKGTVVELDQDGARITRLVEEVQRRMRAMQYRELALKNKIRLVMGDAEHALVPGGGKWTYKSDKNGTRALKYKGPKDGGDSEG